MCNYFPLHSSFLQQNMHFKVKINEEKSGTVISGVEDYRALGVYTKTYNKLFVSNRTKVAWKVGIAKDKVFVYIRIIQFDHSVGKFKDVKPKLSLKWGKRSIYVLCDAADIVDIVQKLSST